MRRILDPTYSVEVDSIDETSWGVLLQRFDDGNIYQTWAYEAINSSENSLSHLVLRKEGKPVAAAQSRIARIPLTNIGIAYIRWGPLWCLEGQPPDQEVFTQVMRALRNEYVARRGLFLRVLPFLFDDGPSQFEDILELEGFAQVRSQEPQRTLLIDLGPPLEQLRKGFDQKWRNRLNRAERNGLRVIEGSEDALFKVFIKIYEEMHGRKNFFETSDVNRFRLVQRDLPDSLKMKVFIALHDDTPAAGIICTSIGNVGTYLFGATSDSGLTTQGSYLLQWRALMWLKENGAKWYNLHGINPVANPGTYRFKSGLCGRNGKDVKFLGVYEAGDRALIGGIFHTFDNARMIYRQSRSAITGLMRKAGG